MIQGLQNLIKSGFSQVYSDNSNIVFCRKDYLGVQDFYINFGFYNKDFVLKMYGFSSKNYFFHFQSSTLGGEKHDFMGLESEKASNVKIFFNNLFNKIKKDPSFS